MIWAVVPAAGRSRRMGTCKQLLPLGGGTVIGHIVDALAASGVDGVVVVTAAGEDGIAEALAGRSVQLVENPEADAPMLSSVRCGIRALPGACRAAVQALGDQPAIRAGTVDAMIGAFEAGRGDIVVPTHGGRRGHPLLLAARYFEEVLNEFEDVGLRGLLAAHPEAVCEIEIDDGGVLSDMDRPEDYERELRRLQGGRG